MSFNSFFSEQARKPSGLFGRLIMPLIFNLGNAALNDFMGDILDLKENDHVLEIGFGTGKFINKVAKRLNDGLIEGLDLSETMVAIAKKRNGKYMARGKVVLRQGDFLEAAYSDNRFDKICSANTIYFWSDQDHYARKILRILKPGGRLILAFEDKDQLQHRPLSCSVFKIYSLEEIEYFLSHNGFTGGIDIFSREIKSQIYHCAVALKGT